MSNYLKACSASFFSEHSVSTLISTLSTCQGVWKLVTIAAHDLILVHMDGKCQYSSLDLVYFRFLLII